MGVLHWDIRKIGRHLRPDGRLALLVMLISHANVRRRCYPTIDTLVAETDWGVESITDAKKWLLAHQAIELVPYKHRVDKERDLPPRQHVYQLTGGIYLDDQIYLYLVFPPDEELIIREHINELRFEAENNRIRGKVSPTETSSSEISPTETKDGSIAEGSNIRLPRVVNVKLTPQFDIYIGRANKRYKLAASIWANPYPLPTNHTPEQRLKCIADYREYLLSNPDLLSRVPELQGKVVGCWCKQPNADIPCHGDVLMELADLPEGELQKLIEAAKLKQAETAVAKPTKPRPLFDAVAKHIFGINDTHGMSNASSVNALVNIVRKLCATRASEYAETQMIEAVQGYVAQCGTRNPVQKWKSGFEPAFLQYLEQRLTTEASKRAADEKRAQTPQAPAQPAPSEPSASQIAQQIAIAKSWITRYWGNEDAEACRKYLEAKKRLNEAGFVVEGSEVREAQPIASTAEAAL